MAGKRERRRDRLIRLAAHLLLSLAYLIAFDFLKSAFPETMKRFQDAIFLPALAIFVLMIGFILYRYWRDELSQPVTRR